jgi:hypothetical protein
VFERKEGGTNAWEWVVTLTAPEGESLWGHVAVDGDVVVAGGGDGIGHGYAYVFERNAGGTNMWGRVAKLTASGGYEYAAFGYSLAVEGDKIVVGAPDDGDRGSVYMFGRNVSGTNAWGQMFKITVSDDVVNDEFGISVAAAGDVVAVGSCSHDLDAKAAYVFEGTYRGLFTLAVNSGLHGAIMPSAAVTVAEGDATNFVVSADAYYHIGQLLTNGADDAAAAGLPAYTSVWVNVTADGTVDVLFAENRAPLGTPEWWLAQHHLTNRTFSVEETNDVDGDLAMAAHEYIADTDPERSNSVLAITRLVFSNSCEVSFPCSTARVYRLESTADPLDVEWVGVEGQTDILGSSGNLSLVDTNPAGHRLYRVGVRLP